MTLVSVILTSYNYEDYIAAAIQSVAKQSYKNIELIIVDDGSTDDSINIINFEINKINISVKAFFISNKGQANAINIAFSHVSGEIICFLDSDDIWYEEKVEKIVQLIEMKPDGGIYQHQMDTINGNKREEIINGDVFAMWLKHGKIELPLHQNLISPFFPTSGLTVTKNILKKVMPLPLKLTTCPDGYITRTVSAFGNLYTLEKPLGEWRDHDRNAGKKHQYAYHNFWVTKLMPELNKFYKKKHINLKFYYIPVNHPLLRNYLNPIYVFKHRKKLLFDFKEIIRRYLLKHKIIVSTQDKILNDLKGKYTGKTCYILGRSVAKKNLDEFKDQYVIVADYVLMNSKICDLQKGFICFSDSRIWNNGKKISQKLKKSLSDVNKLRFLFDISGKNIIKKEVKNKLQHQFRFINRNRKVWEKDFENNILKEFCWGDHIVIDMCLPLAFYLGFSEIKLIGCSWNQKKEEIIAKEFFNTYVENNLNEQQIFPEKINGKFREDLWKESLEFINKKFLEQNQKIMQTNNYPMIIN